MKKLFVVAAVMLAAVGAQAQRAVGSWSFQPKVGMNVAGLTKTDDSDARIGLALGAEAEYQLTDLFSLTGGVMYSQQGTKWTGDMDIYDIPFNGTATLKLDYINVPILANVYVAKGFAVKLGLQPGFLVNKQVKIKAMGQSISKDIPSEAGLNTFDLSIPVGVSYEYKNVQLDARYNWGVTNVAKDSDTKNSVFQFTLGYKF
ncbi:MAG: porin family protein [Prevotella sp.]|nr:porin family protein [Prevotellaceae bacterium]MDY3936075.1 porin family protein [Prevotella sp.]